MKTQDGVEVYLYAFLRSAVDDGSDEFHAPGYFIRE
jgi:hypothetical protein